MPDTPYNDLIIDTRQFLSKLATQNTRDWFLAHKDQYDRTLKSPALVLMDVVSADIEKLTGHPVKTKLFRPHRDVRFSKDKTPYHLHLHMLWQPHDVPCAFCFGIDLDRIVFGTGAMGFDKKQLVAFRERIDGPKGADLARMITDMESQGFQAQEPELKRVPSPFDANHPRKDFLRRKSLTLWHSVQPETTDLRRTLKNGFTTSKPLLDWLSRL